MKEKHNTPIGDVWINASLGCITGVYFSENTDIHGMEEDLEKNLRVIQLCKMQLDEYFAGTRKLFDIEINPQGTKFRKIVWDALLSIEYGRTKSYKDIAVQIGKPLAIRAVGGANHNNPISIIIPCHRVIGANGSLTGYGGGLEVKEWLLNHEKRFI